MEQLFIQFINYVWYLLHVSALHCHLQGAFLLPSEKCSIEEQSISAALTYIRITQSEAARKRLTIGLFKGACKVISTVMFLVGAQEVILLQRSGFPING
jgi:hypothetical protein